MKEISEALSDAIFTVCNKIISKAKYDKTYRCRVLNKISDNKYLVVKDGVEHTVSSNFDYNVNDTVTVLLPQNDWSNAIIIYPQNIKETNSGSQNTNVNNVNSCTSITIQDTRNDNYTPLWYRTNYGKRVVAEFKLCYVIGLTTSILDYTPLITVVPWDHESGGFARQIAWLDTKMYHRVGTSDTSWGKWIAL